MQSFRTFSQGILSIVATLLVFLLVCEDALAQGRRGGGRRRGAGGGVDLSPIRNDQYSNLPGGAYDLVKGNEETFRRLPLPIRFFVLDSLTDWDDFFPREKERFKRFFVKAGEASDGDLHAAFGVNLLGLSRRGTTTGPRSTPRSGRAARHRTARRRRRSRGNRAARRPGTEAASQSGYTTPARTERKD